MTCMQNFDLKSALFQQRFVCVFFFTTVRNVTTVRKAKHVQDENQKQVSKRGEMENISTLKALFAFVSMKGEASFSAEPFHAQKTW